MTTDLTLHYAPDNASLPVRLVLEELGLTYRTCLVDRAVNAQNSPRYLAINPAGKIPALETPHGTIFETAAILLWLADTTGRLAPAPDHPGRGPWLKWVFFASNTLHADLRRLFYPGQYIGSDPADQIKVQENARQAILRHLALLNEATVPDQPLTVLDFYLVSMLRWCALYPAQSDRSWFDLTIWPHLFALAQTVETRPATRAAQIAEGLGPTPFTAPRAPNPPEGTAL